MSFEGNMIREWLVRYPDNRLTQNRKPLKMEFGIKFAMDPIYNPQATKKTFY